MAKTGADAALDVADQSGAHHVAGDSVTPDRPRQASPMKGSDIFAAAERASMRRAAAPCCM